jgi:hypothetical protein
MNISPADAEESLEAIQKITRKTRRSIATSGVYITLIVTGIVWLVGFVSTQFLTGAVLAYIWTGLSLGGTALAVLFGMRRGRRVRNATFNETAKRAALFWALLLGFGLLAIAIAHPTDGKQVTMFVIVFTMLGQSAMGLLLSFSAVWWALPVTLLAALGYFFLPNYFYLWMGVLVGGGMIALALYIRARW